MGGDEVAVPLRLDEDHGSARPDLSQDLDQLFALVELGDLQGENWH